MRPSFCLWDGSLIENIRRNGLRGNVGFCVCDTIEPLVRFLLGSAVAYRWRVYWG